MAQRCCSDGGLAYAHCLSIFSGANAKIRDKRKIIRLLEEHKADIKALTNIYTMPDIVVAVKGLLEDQIFESLPRAKLRYPELFQPLQALEAKKVAPVAKIVKPETKETHEVAVTLGEKNKIDGADSKNNEQHVELSKTTKVTAAECVPANHQDDW